ncbi:protein phosphatase 2C domain-containing protein [Thermodesulfobium sp. 4217-1]|uniref:PP2C family protein-serine/threonine phosphatase n=1 Tax=Thermodesulfobium sp. 4217-1 TaxID=3120013 RepID=UPI0032218BB9
MDENIVKRLDLEKMFNLFEVIEDFGQGWSKCRYNGEFFICYNGEKFEAYEKILNSKIFPEILSYFENTIVFKSYDAKKLSVPLDPEHSLLLIKDISEASILLKDQGYMFNEINIADLVKTENGFKFSKIPNIISFSDFKFPNQLFEIEDYTIKLLGSLLYELLSGISIKNGFDIKIISRYDIPGIPQFLSLALPGSRGRISLKDAFNMLSQICSSIEAQHCKYSIGSSSTIGLNVSRTINEDSFGYAQMYFYNHFGKHNILKACIADGMGGMEAGETASKSAVDAFLTERFELLDDDEHIANQTIELAWKANKAVFDSLNGKNGGCTFSGTVIYNDRLYIAHVGDTRIYLYKNDNLERLSNDHSLVETLILGGIMTREEALNSPDRNKLLRSMGFIKDKQENYIEGLFKKFEKHSIQLVKGDVVLIVSDGVWGEIPDDELLAVIRSLSHNPDDLVDELISVVLKRGAPDNATAIAIYKEF